MPLRIGALVYKGILAIRILRLFIFSIINVFPCHFIRPPKFVRVPKHLPAVEVDPQSPIYENKMAIFESVFVSTAFKDWGRLRNSTVLQALIDDLSSLLLNPLRRRS